MMVKVRYNHSYPIGGRYHEWHNYDKSEVVDVDEFTTKALQTAIDEKEGSGNNAIISCKPVMEE